MGGSKFPCPFSGMAARGYAVASVEYRFSQNAVFPAQIQDCQAAIRWLRSNSQKFNLDPDHIGAIGGSAGGHLSTLVGTAGGKKAFPPIGGNEDQSDRVQCVCDIFGPSNFATVIQQAAELKKKGVSVWLQTLPGSGHGGAAFGKPEIIMLTQNFLDKYLKSADVPIELVPEASVAVKPAQ